MEKRDKTGRYYSKAELLRRGRRKFLLQALGLTAAGLTAGGAATWLLNRRRKSEVSDSPEIAKYYPEAAGYDITQIENVQIGKVSLRIINFSQEYQVDPNVIKTVVESILKVARNHTDFTDGLTVNNLPLGWALEPDGANQKVLFLADRRMPKPEWSGSGYGTTLIQPGEYTVTFVKATTPADLVILPPGIRSDEILAISTIMGVELCNAFIRTGTIYPDTYNLNIPPANLIQELFCNSLGRTVALRQLRITHPDYIKIMNSDQIIVPTDPITMPYYTLTSGEYAAIPTTPFIEKR